MSDLRPLSISRTLPPMVPAADLAALADGIAGRRVRTAYEQIADRLRELIVTGRLVPGTRLPTEQALAADFGVSRATAREALRVLASEGLVETRKGTTGGSFVTRPSVGLVGAFLERSMHLLSDSDVVSLDALLETRRILEVPAARLAAERRADVDVERLAAAARPETTRLPVDEQFERNRDFHVAICESCGNALLALAAQPIFAVLQTRLARAGLGPQFHRQLNDQHRLIADAIGDADTGRAADEMETHLEWLAPYYRRAWTTRTAR